MLNLGDINFGVDVDTSSFGPAMAKIVQFGDVVDAVSKRTGDSAAAMASAMRRQEAATTSALQTVLNFNSQVGRLKAPTQFVTDITKAFDDLSAGMTRGALGTLEYQRTQEQFTAAMGNARRGLAEWSAAQAAANRANAGGANSINPWIKGMHDFSSAVVIAEGPLSGIGSRVSALNSLFTRQSLVIGGVIAGVITLSLTMIKLNEAAIQTAITLQNVEAQYTAMTGSTVAAADELDHLKSLANTTGTEFLNLAKQFGEYQTAGKEAGLTGTAIRQSFDDIVAASARFHLSTEQTSQVLETFERLLSRGVVSPQLLRGLSTDLPGAADIAAKAMNMTMAQFQQFLKSGNEFSADFVPKLAAALKSTYGGSTTTPTEGIQNDLNRMHNSITSFNQDFDKAFNTSKTFDAGVKALGSTIAVLGAGLDHLDQIIVAVAAGLATAAAPGLITLWTSLEVAVWGLVAAYTALDAAEVAEFWTSVGSVILRLGLALVGAAAGWELMSDNQTKAQSQTQQSIQSTNEFIKAQEAAGKAAAVNIQDRINANQKDIDSTKASLAAAKERANILGKTIDSNGQFGGEGAAGLSDAYIQAEADVKRYSDQLAVATGNQAKLTDELKKAKAAEADLKAEQSERLTDEITQLQNQIDANNRIGAAYASGGEGAGQFAAKQEQVKSAVEAAAKALKAAGDNTPGDIDKITQALADSLNNKDSGEAAAKMSQDAIKISESYQIAAASVKSVGLGEYLKKQFEVKDEARALEQSLIGMGIAYQKAASAAAQFAAAKNTENKSTDTADLSKMTREIENNEALADAFMHSKGAGEQLQKTLADHEAEVEFTNNVAKLTGDLEQATAMGHAFRQSLTDLEDAKAADAVGEVNQQIEKYQRLLAGLEQGPRALKEAEQANAMAEQAEAKYKELLAAGNSEDVAKQKSQELVQAMKNFDTMQEQLKPIQDAWTKFGDTLDEVWDKAFETGFTKMQDLVNIVRQSVLQIIAEMIRLQVIMPILRQIGNWGSGVLDNLGISLPGITSSGDFDPAGVDSVGSTSSFGYAAGGDPPMGQYSLVGEKGPELFKPKQPGTIIPFDKLGGGHTFNIDAPTYVSLAGANGTETIVAITKAAVEQGKQQTMATIKKQLPGMILQAQQESL